MRLRKSMRLWRGTGSCSTRLTLISIWISFLRTMTTSTTTSRCNSLSCSSKDQPTKKNRRRRTTEGGIRFTQRSPTTNGMTDLNSLCCSAWSMCLKNTIKMSSTSHKLMSFCRSFLSSRRTTCQKFTSNKKWPRLTRYSCRGSKMLKWSCRTTLMSSQRREMSMLLRLRLPRAFSIYWGKRRQKRCKSIQTARNQWARVGVITQQTSQSC